MIASRKSGPPTGRGGPLAGRGGPWTGHWPGHLALALAGCTPMPTSTTPAAPRVTVRAPDDVEPDDAEPDGFSGTRALERLAHWLDAPRGLGDPRRAASIAALAGALEDAGARLERLDHEVVDPQGGTRFALTELVGHLRPDAPRRFVLATHFDTRPWADEEPDAALHQRPVPGANDGTSGVAVVLELLAPLHAGLPEDVGVSIVLFDGEELGHPEEHEAGRAGYCMGSRYLAERIAAGEHPLLAKAELGVVLDMVGDRDLQVLIEPGSQANHPRLVEHVWSVAGALGEPAFVAEVRGRGIVDDHKFLTQAGIPSVLLIDREYAHWHRTTDTIDQVSAASLDAVGDVVLRALLSWFAPRATLVR